MKNKTDEEKDCPVCNSKMIDKGFSDDWKIYECSSSTCETKIEEAHTKDPQEEGFTMESLQMASDYADETDDN